MILYMAGGITSSANLTKLGYKRLFFSLNLRIRVFVFKFMLLNLPIKINTVDNSTNPNSVIKCLLFLGVARKKQP